MSCSDLEPVWETSATSVTLQYNEDGECEDTASNAVSTLRVNYTTERTVEVNFVPKGVYDVPTHRYTDCSTSPPAPVRDTMARYFKITFEFPASTGEHGWDFAGNDNAPPQLQIRVRVKRL